jgi:hypothetical protein
VVLGAILARIILIRRLMLGPLRADAERRARQAAHQLTIGQ